MYDADSPEPPRRSSWPLFLIFGLMLICVVLSIVAYQRSTDQPASLSDSGFSFTKVDVDKPVPIEPLASRHWGGPGIQANSSLKMVEPSSDESILASVAVGTGAVRQPGAAAAKPSEAPAQDPAKLTAGEEKVLQDLLGKNIAKMNAETVGETLSQQGMGPKIGMKLLAYPRIFRFVVNNPLVVEVAMKLPLVRQTCSSETALKRYYSDTKNPNGVSVWLAGAKEAQRYPGSAKILAESQLTATYLKQCTPVSTLSKDLNGIKEVMTANPALAGAMPFLMEAASDVPSLQSYYADLQKIQTSVAVMPQGKN